MFKHSSLPLDTKFCIKLTSKKLNIHNSKSENQCWPSIFTKLSQMLASQKSWSTARVISSSRSRRAEWKKNQTCCFLFSFSWFRLQPTLKCGAKQDWKKIAYKEKTSEVICMHMCLGGTSMPDLKRGICWDNVVMARGISLNKDIVGSLS